mgnify:CR=1 FL=1
MTTSEKLDLVFAKDVSVDFLFTHLRNIGLCAVLQGIGFFLFNADCTVYQNPLIGQTTAAIFIIGVAMLMGILNVMQLSLSVAKQLRAINRVIATVLMAFLTIWVQIIIFYVVNTQSINLLNSFSKVCIQ